MNRLDTKVALITGGANGQGAIEAELFIEAGATVVITDINDAAGAATADRLGPRCTFVQHDVSSEEDWGRVVQTTLDLHGRIDVLVNNAGLGMRIVSERFNVEPTRFWETDPAKWRAIVDANVNGTFYMAAAVTPGMIERGFGKIINVSTSDQTMVRKGYAPYGPSKAAIEAASRCWSQDLAGTGVDVNVYLPGGAADTDLLPPSADRKGADGNLLPAAIMRRGIGWLASDASNGVTGARFIARLWDETRDPAEAAEGARSPHVDKPAIM